MTDPVDYYDCMEEARIVAKECYHDNEIKIGKLIQESIASRISAWMYTAAQNQRNTDYYRGLLEKCGNSIGDRAFICDDGTKSEDVLCAKIPEIIANDYCDPL